MDTNRITGLALIFGPLIAIIGWFSFFAVAMNGVAPDDAEKFIAELGTNSTAIKYLFPAATLAFLLGVGGLGFIKNSMRGGPGHYMAGFGFLLVLVGSAGQLGETSLMIATAEAAHNANMAVASSMFAGAQATGAITTAISMLGFALFGVGILQQKNFSPILAGLMIIVGIFTVAGCLIDYESLLIPIGFLGIVASFIWLGVSLLTKKTE